MREGQFVNYDGSKVHLQTVKGPWSMFAPKAMESMLSQIAPNTMVQFECSKPAGKNYWRLDSLVPAGSTVPPTPTPAPMADNIPPWVNKPEHTGQPTHGPVPALGATLSGGDKDENMFVMGVCGRAMGSGNFSIEDIPALAKWAVIGWRGRFDNQ